MINRKRQLVRFLPDLQFAEVLHGSFEQIAVSFRLTEILLWLTADSLLLMALSEINVVSYL
jgi:hypothetical protein